MRISCPGPKTSLDGRIRYTTFNEKFKRIQTSKDIPNILQNGRDSILFVSSHETTSSPSSTNPHYTLRQGLDTFHISLPQEQAAEAYFRSRFILTPYNQSQVGLMGFVVRLDIDRQSTHYWLAFKACAVAAFTNMIVNRYHYNKTSD